MMELSYENTYVSMHKERQNKKNNGFYNEDGAVQGQLDIVFNGKIIPEKQFFPLKVGQIIKDTPDLLCAVQFGGEIWPQI